MILAMKIFCGALASLQKDDESQHPLMIMIRVVAGDRCLYFFVLLVPVIVSTIG